jgi:predicted  nucleic acid-binding Zn-ribbon protein
MPGSPPWTEIGRLQSDVSGILSSKANRHDLDALRGTVYRLERSLLEARSEIDGLRNQVSQLEQEVRDLRFAAEPGV